jgi:uncharacterized protein (TIGR02996 family)
MARTRKLGAPAASRDADLEAVIAEDPDDAARYLVYADWLQQRDEPRGFLISLHHASHQHPRDKARAAVAAALLHVHRHALLGPLEPYVRPRDGRVEIELDWFMGFIRGARLRARTSVRLAAVLACLLESPSSVFLQELVIEPPATRRGPDPGPIVARLLERPPRSLCRLQIGRPGAWQVPPALRDALPRLGRDPAVVWAEVTAAIARQRRLKVELDATALPAPRPRPGGPALAVDLEALLVGLKVELDKQRPLGVLAALPQLFTRDSLDALAFAMAIQWIELGEDAPKWCFDALGPLGGDRTAALLGEHLERWSHARCVQALEHLRRIGSDLAIAEIAALALRPNGYRPRREAARGLLGEVAVARGLAGADQLLDRTCPIEPTRRVLDAQRWWLESLIVSGHRIAADDFRRSVLAHPVRRPLAETLLWGEFVGPRLIQLLRVDGGGAYELQQRGAAGHGIGLVHPAELDPPELDRVRGALAGVRQAVPQLDRPVFRLAPDEHGPLELTRFAERRVGFYALEAALEQRDWFVYEQDDGGGTAAFGKELARDGIIAVAALGGANGSIGEVIIRPRGSRIGARRWGSLHPVTISELLWDLEVAHGRRVPPLPAPIVERARSGRSRCVVCGEAIAKDSLRIGVERVIETPAYQGRATVWLHPQCRAGAPELEGTDLDELLR